MANIMGRAVLEKTGRFHLGEMVSCFVRGAKRSHPLSSRHSSDALHLGSLSIEDVVESGQLKPEVVFFTSSGKIGVMVDVPDLGTSTQLSGLERNLASVIKGVGGMNHAEYGFSFCDKSFF